MRQPRRPNRRAARRWAGEQASSDAAWAARLEEGHQRWLRERGELERASTDKLAVVQEVAGARHDALRSQLEARVAGISGRLTTLAAKEGRKEASARELKKEVRRVARGLRAGWPPPRAGLPPCAARLQPARNCARLGRGRRTRAQADELRAALEGEARRRRELEATLHEAAVLFRRELAGKAGELHRLQGAVRRMRRTSGQEGAAAAAAALAVVTAAPPQLDSPSGQQPPCYCSGSGGACACGRLLRGRSTGAPTAAPAGSPAASLHARAAAAAPPCSPPAPPARGCSPGVAAACDLVGGELAALREARHSYAAAALEQDRLRNDLLASLGERLASPARGAPRCCSSSGLRWSGEGGSGPHSRRREPDSSSRGHARTLTAAARAAGGGSECSWEEGGGGGGEFRAWHGDLSRRLGSAMRKLDC